MILIFLKGTCFVQSNRCNLTFTRKNKPEYALTVFLTFAGHQNHNGHTMITLRTLVTLIAFLLPIPLAAQLNTTQQNYLAALDALSAGKIEQFNKLSKSLSHYILTPYLEYERIRYGQYKDTQAIKIFLERYPNQSISYRLHKEWLLSLPGRGEWDTFLVNYDENLRSSTLHCYYLRALYRSGEKDKALERTKDAWITSGSAPKACTPLFKVWLKSPYFEPDFAYERLQLALKKGRTSLASYSANFLKGDQRAAANMMIWAHKSPSILSSTKRFPSANPYMKDAVLHGLKRRVRRRPDVALTYWKKHQDRFDFSVKETAELERKIYLGLARQFDQEASDLLASLPPEYNSREVLEWQIRVSLRTRDWSSVLKWVEVLEKTEKMDPQWYYWKHQAYLAQSIKVPQQDMKQLYKLAKTRTYYGFLTAELLGTSFSLTNSPLPISLGKHKEVGSIPEIDRAKEFLNIGQTKTAKREWQYVVNTKADPLDLMSLAKLAKQWGWHNRAIRTVIAANHWHDLSIRFPTPYKQAFVTAANQVNLDSSWLFAIARQESAFAEGVRSGAGARGLMQLMPATARQTAKKIGLKPSKNSLYDPSYNIKLGSNYLANMYLRFNKNRAIATAAYNAGPNRVKQWVKSSPALSIDVWIETIPYDETRRYVKNVLAFDTIYQHKLGENNPVLLHGLERIFVSEITLSKASTQQANIAVK